MHIFLPEALLRSNNEMIPLPNELRVLQPLLSRITARVKVMQGKKDWLVPYKHALFIRNALVNAKVDVSIFPHRGHFLRWQEFDRVKRIILEEVSHGACTHKKTPI